MTDLQQALAELAQRFATQVIQAIGSVPLQEVAALAGGLTPTRGVPRASSPSRATAGRPAKAAKPAKAAAPAPRRGAAGRRRRSAGDLAALGNRIVTLLKENAGGLRAEAIRDRLGVPRKELPRVFGQLVTKGLVKKSGQKRATTYFVGDGSAVAKPAAPAKPGAPKPATKPAKKAAKAAKPAKKAKK